MEDEGKIILSAEDEVRLAKKVEEGDRFQYGTKEFENQYQSVVEVISRITGWSAHIMEQHAANKLIRPLASYKGNKHRKVLQLNQR